MIRIWKSNLIWLVMILLFCSAAAVNRTALAQQSTNHPVVDLKTNMGDIQLELYPDKAPATVENFLSYVNSGFYINTLFHRVIPGFMIQGGGFTHGLQEKATKPPIKNEAGNGLSNKRGTIAMARTNDINSATAEFFINLVDNDYLDHKGASPEQFGYCVFGKVIKGMNIVDKIAKVQTHSVPPYDDVPIKDVKILSASVLK